MSATSADAFLLHPLMINTIKTIVNTYGTGNTRYNIMAFGSSPVEAVGFSDVFLDKEALKRRLDQIRRVRGIADLKAALAEAEKSFKGAGSRPKARKILVVIIDNKSGNNVDDVRNAAKSLEANGVCVIPVAVGAYANPAELAQTTPLKDNLIKVPKSEKPKQLAKKIMDKIEGSK